MRAHAVSSTFATSPDLVLVPEHWGPVVQARQALLPSAVVLASDDGLFPVADSPSVFFIDLAPGLPRAPFADEPPRTLEAPVSPTAPSPASLPPVASSPVRALRLDFPARLGADYIVGLVVFLALASFPAAVSLKFAGAFGLGVFIALAVCDTWDRFLGVRVSLWAFVR